ncbi:hypothetical protein ACSQ67_017047 [Phaseolus vulgaris]
MMNPDVEAWDESNIEITIARDYLSHHQTHPPVATSHAVTPSDMYWHAYMGEWGEMEAIVRNDRNSVRIGLTGSGDTALHVAAGAGNTTFVQELIKFMKIEEQLIPNSEEMLAVHLAALSRHHRIVKHLCSQQHLLDKMAYKDIEKLFFMTISNNMFDVAISIFENCPELSTARDEDKLTALHMLARKPSTILWFFFFYQHSTILCMELRDDNYTEELIVNVVEIPLEDDKVTEEELMGHVYVEIKKKVFNLTFFSSGMELEENKNSGPGIVLLKRIWAEVQKLKMEEIIELITRPSVALFDAIKSESDDQVIDTFLEYITLLTTVKDPQGRNLLHLLCLHRRREFFDTRVYNLKEKLARAVDNEGNNVLHLAAFSNSIPIILRFKSIHSNAKSSQMVQGDFIHFSILIQSFFITIVFEDISYTNLHILFVDKQKVERKVPRELKSARNKNGKRPVDVFCDEHKQLSNDIKEAAKGIVDSGMIVSTLVATVAFAAALTVPGDKNNSWFIFFIITNAVALFTSLRP